MTQARSKHEIFVSDYQAHKTTRFSTWWEDQWLTQIAIYNRLGWKMIPIAVRGKLPLHAHDNYESHGAAGPYLTVEDARKWTSKDFNLAVVAGPSGILWIDLDDPSLFRESFRRGLVMRTPRGFAMPLKADNSYTEISAREMKAKGYDFREDIAYELVPLSETCTKDHALHAQRHPGPRESCLDRQPHDYKVREWITPMSNPLLTFGQVYEAVRT